MSVFVSGGYFRQEYVAAADATLCPSQCGFSAQSVNDPSPVLVGDFREMHDRGYKRSVRGTANHQRT